MRTYSNKITLSKNSRGIYSLDPSLGCHSGTVDNKNGCYGDCYAVRLSRAYGYNFSNTVLRYFESEKHKESIVKKIDKIPLPFVRMGTMGDPSEDWEHTLDVCEQISIRQQLSLFSFKHKDIVIITRHWKTLTDSQLKRLKSFPICVNTSVSALDEPDILNSCLEQYERLKPYCKSLIRVISCNFNLENKAGHAMHKVQQRLFSYPGFIDTVFRPSKNNPFVTSGVINVKKEVFNGKPQLASKFNRKTYMGKCSSCKEMCGVNIKV